MPNKIMQEQDAKAIIYVLLVLIALLVIALGISYYQFNELERVSKGKIEQLKDEIREFQYGEPIVLPPPKEIE